MTFGKLVDKAKEKSKEATASLKEVTTNLLDISKDNPSPGAVESRDGVAMVKFCTLPP